MFFKGLKTHPDYYPSKTTFTEFDKETKEQNYKIMQAEQIQHFPAPFRYEHKRAAERQRGSNTVLTKVFAELYSLMYICVYINASLICHLYILGKKEIV